jgi:glycerol kinase
LTRALVLALDQGSSSSRAIAFDERGRAVFAAQRPVKTFHPREGWIEHDALDLARTLEASLDEVLAKIPAKTELVGAGLACQRSTVVFWDKATGKPAARVPSWQDGRAVSVVAPMQDKQAWAHERTGLYLTPYYSAPKIRWFLDHSEPVRRLADRGRLLVGPVSTWLTWRLTKGEVFAADPSMAQRMMLLDLKTLDWDEGMLGLFGLSRELLPAIRPSSGDWGSFTRKGRTVKLLAALGDQQAAALGLGGRPEGSSVANYGTGAFLLHNAGTTPRRVPGLLTSVAWKAGGAPASYLLEGTVHAAGTSFDWLRGSLGLMKSSAELDALCRAAKHRVWALPAIGGLGAPRWDYKTKTAFFGLTSQTTRAELVRGVMEGLAFMIADIAAAMRAGGASVTQARVSGGLSRVPSFMQFQADVLGAPLSRCAEGEATALGAASLAAEAAGAPWAARLAQPRVDKVFSPKLDGAAAKTLHGQWTRFVDAQARLSRELS